MEEKHLIRICLIGSILGVVILFSVSLIEPEEVKIKNIDERMIGDFVSVNAVVNSLRTHDGNAFFTLKQGGYEIKAVIFDNKYDINNRDEVIVQGEITKYKGSLEIIINELSLYS